MIWIIRVGDTANFGIYPIPSDYRASIANTDTDTFHSKIPDHLMIWYFWLWLADHDYNDTKTQDKDFNQIRKYFK